MNRTAILTGLGVIVAGAALTFWIAPGSTASSAAPAAEVSQMDDTEFGERVRRYLLANPEVIFEAAEVLQQRQEEMQSANDIELIAQHSDAIFNDTHSWVGGNPEGDITIVEFTDYMCGYCRRAFPEVEELLTSDGNIRFIIKEFPILGEQSILASRFAIAALQTLGDDAYRALHDAMMTAKGDMSLPALSSLAESLGLDAQKITDHMDSDAVAIVIAENRALAQALQISGTPTFIMQDQLVRGYVPLDGMREIVKEIRG